MSENQPTAAAMRAAIAITSRFDLRPDPGLVREHARIIDAEFSESLTLIEKAIGTIARKIEEAAQGVTLSYETICSVRDATRIGRVALARVRGGGD